MHYLHIDDFSANNSYFPASGCMYRPGLINKYIWVYQPLNMESVLSFMETSVANLCFWWYLGKLSSGSFVIDCQRTLWRDEEIKNVCCFRYSFVEQDRL